jgi:hypothetical protein
MEKVKREKIKQALKELFSKADDAEFYFIKTLKEFSNSVLIKSKKVDSEKLSEANLLLKKELADPAIELLNWIDTVGGIIPKKNVYKIPFFSTSEIKEFSPWRVCPIGEYWVIRHDRQKKHLEDVDGHCRKNKSKKDQLKGDEIDLISIHDLFKNPTLKATTNNLGFEKDGKNGNQFDDLINGWVAYWNDVFKTDPPLRPNFVKALMATESGFNPKSIAPNKNKKIGFARGLMQVTERTQRQLAGDEKELKDHLVILDDEEVWDPNKNICAGVRWLFRKREILKSQIKRDPTWKEVLMGYKGKTTSQTKRNQRIRKDLTDFLKKLGV